MSVFGIILQTVDFVWAENASISVGRRGNLFEALTFSWLSGADRPVRPSHCHYLCSLAHYTIWHDYYIANKRKNNSSVALYQLAVFSCGNRTVSRNSKRNVSLTSFAPFGFNFF